MKTRKLYQVRIERSAGESSKQVGFKMRLLDRSKALKVAKFLKKRHIDAFIAPLTVNV